MSEHVAWRIERFEIPQTYPEAWPKIGDRVFHEHYGEFGATGGWFIIEEYDVREGDAEPYGVRLVPAPGQEGLPGWISTTDLIGIRPRRKFVIRATARTPDGAVLSRVFEDIGTAMRIGREL